MGLIDGNAAGWSHAVRGAPVSDAAAGDAVREAQDFPLVFATMPATGRHQAIAVGVVCLLLAAAVVVAPFASIPVARVDAFIPVLQTVVSVADLVTATLLFAQFSVYPQPALLALGSGYIFSGSFAFLYTLAFPGAYAADGLIGDGPNSPAWIYVLWQTTFPAAILAYALSKDTIGVSTRSGRSPMALIIITVACVLAVIAVLTWIVTAKTEYLPRIFNADIRLQTQVGNQLNVALWLWGATVLTVLLFRRRTILDLCMIVTLIACMPSFLVAVIGSSIRFTVGWYAARGFILVASCTLLTVLFVETTLLYSRLASAIVLQRRERINRLLSVDAITAAIAHELRNPLGAIALNASTILSQLQSTPRELEGIEDTVRDIETDSHRASAIISSIRALSNEKTEQRALISVESAVRLVLRLLQHDLQMNAVSVATEFQGNLPEVHLDGTQLQQVLLNLAKNAIEAMSVVAPEARLLRLTICFDGHSNVLLSVQDSGPGIPVKDQERIFDPFFTTKSSGMGLGLAICFAVVEKQGGKLRLVKSDFNGSIFELAIPVGGSVPG
jgi:signal transduction histidine kinase